MNKTDISLLASVDEEPSRERKRIRLVAANDINRVPKTEITTWEEYCDRCFIAANKDKIRSITT